MSAEFRYDPESGSFRPIDRSGRRKDSDWGSWVLIAAMFGFGLWPIGLFLLVSKLKDSPRKNYAAQGAKQTASGNAKVAKAARKMTRSPAATDGTAAVLTVVGAIVFFFFGFLTPVAAVEDGFVEALPLLGFSLGGLTTLLAGFQMRKRSNRIKRYAAVIGEREWVSLAELSAVVGRKRKTVERDLEFMVEKGMFSTLAYVDSGRGVLFRSAEAAQKYARERSEKENLTPKEATEGYSGALRAIRYANDRIADPMLSAKIDHLETIAGKIFREVEAHPEKRMQIAAFFNYYLPTTLKILNTYAEFEQAGIQGENLQRSRERIEETMDMLVKGFDKHLDDLYRNEAMDIDSDIRVMENMLKRDISSVEEDFGLGGSAVQRRPDEE